jgi:hypothetical protein
MIRLWEGTMSVRRKPFVIDYEVVGTFYIKSPNENAATARAIGILNRATSELREIGVYCETEITNTIDAEERYQAKA